MIISTVHLFMVVHLLFTFNSNFVVPTSKARHSFWFVQFLIKIKLEGTRRRKKKNYFNTVVLSHRKEIYIRSKNIYTILRA